MGEKGLAEAYILGIPFGLFGAHHFYLGRRNFGIVYACTLGLFGLGWLFDLVRMRWLVKHANRQEPNRKMVSDAYIICALTGLFGGHQFYLGHRKLGIFYACTVGVFTVGWIADLIRMKYLVKDHNEQREGKSLGTAYILGLSPLGIFGAYHYYLGNVKLGLIYTFTVGIFGIGWIVDLFRMSQLVQKAGLDKKSVATSYIMAMPPFGLFGAYHYYLGNYGLGITYTLTLGIFSIGWLVDLFRMKDLVKAANDPTSDHGTTKVTAYILCVSPLGIFGAHHFYLRRHLNGGFYALTVGLFGIGWIFDWFRLPVLYERYAGEDKHKYPDEAYLYWFPFGIFGMHHFYLGNKKWGILYACTFGCLFFGWIVDGIRMFQLLGKFNKFVQDPDMNPFRVCRPSCSGAAYRCRRCCHRTFSCCNCLESFTLPRSESRRADADMNGHKASKNKDDFDVIREMYPNEVVAMNENETCHVSTVQTNVYTHTPTQASCPPYPVYDSGAHPVDAGLDGAGDGSEYPQGYKYDGTAESVPEGASEEYDQNFAYNEYDGQNCGTPENNYVENETFNENADWPDDVHCDTGYDIHSRTQNDAVVYPDEVDVDVRHQNVAL